MKTAVYSEALAAASPQNDPVVLPMPNGLINQTYKVTIRSTGDKFLLQQINTAVFAEPAELQSNYETIWSWLEEKKNKGADPISIPRPLRFPGGNSIFFDSHNRYWRIVEFMNGTQTIPVAGNPEQARKVAETFARFTASFASFDDSSLAITIPGFHDLSLRFRQFLSSLHSRNYERLMKAAPLVDELKKREHYASFYDVMTGSDAFKKRVMHHDAKISNILFDEETGQVVCPVDLDTCMPGYFFSDLGDMIRSMTCSEDENSIHFDAIQIREDFYRAILQGYLNKMGDHLTGTEKKYIHHSGILIIYMQALRFLADFLNGNIYYRVSYPAQNYDRAKNQLVLLQQLEKFLGEHYQVTV
ncbi:MAG: aminoglycoside phosphotransferase family protein [Chitinophagaceae bacterium]